MRARHRSSIRPVRWTISRPVASTCCAARVESASPSSSSIADGWPDRIKWLRDTDQRFRQDTVVLLALVPWLDWLVAAWQTYLHVGGFPAALAGYLRQREVPPQFLRSLLDVIHGDAFRRADWSRPQTTALLQRVAQGLCSPVNHAAIADDLAFAQPTIRRRLEELRDAFVLWPCHREDRLRPKLNSRAKIYFLDPAYAALGPSLPDDSQLAEQQLGAALLRSCERTRPGSYLDFADVLHHRSNTRREIDFVGLNFGGIAIESKFVDGRWKRDAQTLAASKWRGIVATRSELDVTTSNDVMAVPAAMLAWLVDG